MASNDLLRELQQIFTGVFQWGSRYYAERMGIVVGAAILTMASFVWAFSTPGDSNELGADLFLRDVVISFDLAVQNSGNRAWTDVRIVLDRKYLFTADRVEGGQTLTINSDNLTYAYYVPRPWGREAWEELTHASKPEYRPDASYVPSFVQVRTRQGRLDVTLEEP